MNELLEALTVSGDTPTAGVMFYNLALCTALALLVSWHFSRFGSSFGNRARFARILVPLALTTALVISVIKVSLALSLGLVGALSIVRFRTPIKDPEELVYLFMAIAIGLGTGADQRAVTAASILVILLVITARSALRRGRAPTQLYLSIELPSGARNESRDGDLLKAIVETVGQHAPRVDLRRFDRDGQIVRATFFLDCMGMETPLALQEALIARFPESTLTLVDQSSLPVV